ncbi:acyl--CoA ligase [Amycolatopsis sp. NBC_00345]|uniref:class I adenylate-forming enzyme family protein n=1 Tax=Amycolatopsis sp. NBC_00345 TaxID=2975955 RepID=UPI002E257655
MWRAAAVEALLARTTDTLSPDEAPELEAFTAGITAADLPAGSPVLLALPNGKALLVMFFAVLNAGLVPVPVPPGATAGRLLGTAHACGAAAVIAPRTHRLGDGPVYRIGCVELIRLPGTPRRHPAGSVIITTSGTSGIATGCLHDIDRLLRNAARHADAVGQRAEDTVLVTLPMYFSYALVAQCLAALVRGSRLVISGPPFTPRHYTRILARHDVTLSSLTPALVRRLLGERTALPAVLRTLTVGGDQLGAELVPPLLQAIPGGELYLTYGLTEAGPRVSTLAAHAEPARRHGSAGLPLPSVRTALRPGGIDEGSQELVVYTDTPLRGRVPSGSPLLPDGGIATGDLFHIDDDGYHFFRGRVVDSVTVNGEKVWLPSIRSVAAGLDGVRRAVTRVHRDGADTHYDLEVYVDSPEPGQDVIYHRELSRHLLRSERPRAVIVEPYLEEGWHK